MDHSNHLDELIAALRTPGRAEAVERLVHLGEPGLYALVKALDQEDHWSAEAAAALLVRIGEPAVDPVFDLLDTLSGAARCRGVRVLGEIGPPAALDPLLHVLRDGDPYARRAAAAALVRFPGPETINALCGALGDEDTGVRINVMSSLARLQHPGVPSALRLALAAGEPLARASAAVALGDRGEHAAAGCLLSALDDREPQVRACAADALGRLKAATAVDALVELLHDPEENVRRAAVRALGKIGDARAVDALCRALHDPGLLELALGALGNLTADAAARAEGEIPAGCGSPRLDFSQEAVQALCEVLGWGDSEHRRQVAHTLYRLAIAAPSPLLRRALPVLRSVCSPLSTERFDVKQTCSATVRKIELATRSSRDLPVPATPPASPVEELPVPGSAPRADGAGY